MKVQFHDGTDQQQKEMATGNSPEHFSPTLPETFIFDSKIDELTSQLKRTLEKEEKSCFPEQEIEVNSERTGKMETSHPPITSARSLSFAVEEMELGEIKPFPPTSPCPGKKRDWKIPRFLRRTQSASEDEDGHSGLFSGMARGTTPTPPAAGRSTAANIFFPPPKNKNGERCRTASGSKVPRDPSPNSSFDRPRSSSDIDKDSSSNKWKVKGGMEMKFGLGFLKRRHTEGQISPPSIRPTPEEARKWAESFQNLMISKYGQCLFKAFLRREFSHENIEFWIAVEQYRKARERKLPSKAQKIINEFVLSQSPREVNLDSATRDVLITSATLSQPDYNTFDQAQKKIQGILEADAYIRFLQSDLYLELIHPERYSMVMSPESPDKPNVLKIDAPLKDQKKPITQHADSIE